MIKNKLKKKVISGFDDWSLSYTNDVVPKLKRRGHSYDQLAQNIISFLKPELSANVLEIGVGTGILGSKIKQYRPDLKIVGLDISSNMLLESKQLDVYDALFQCDAESIPFQSDTFQFVFSGYMFHSALNAKKCLREVYRICKPSANLVIVDLFRTARRIALFSRLKDNIHSIKYEHGAISNYHRPNEFEKMLQKTNFQLGEKYKLDTNQQDNPAGRMFHYLFAAHAKKR
jgi:ubiquinone/menaquinone biosynthesis C-methylase UbiE